MANGAKLPESIMSGFMVYPFRLSLLFAEKSDSIFEWWVSHKTYEEKPNEEIKDWVSKHFVHEVVE